MLFSSAAFLTFLPIVFCGYWYVARYGSVAQNFFIGGVSLVFYGWTDIRLCGLLLISISTAYYCALQIAARRKCFLYIGVGLQLGLLAFFKYYNFFVSSITQLFGLFGLRMDLPTLKIILPVGLSFYSFMAIAYMVDVHRKSVAPIRSPLLFFSCMSFFPQLLAGPIGRMSNLLSQFEKVRCFEYAFAVDGCRQMLWGYFKKLVIADGCASLTDQIYADVSQCSGSVLLLGAFMYAIQIYADFSGYSDIAVGCGKLFGIRLQINFKCPYFATNISEFWRRWHISLTTWFRDYLYIPLGGSRCSKGKQFCNTLVVFALSGLWHGANWTFVIWGILHAILFLPMIFFRKFINLVESFGVGKFILGVTTFISVMLCWVFFRSTDFTMARNYLSCLFSASLFTIPKSHLSMLPLILVSIIVEWFGRSREHSLDIATWPKLLRWGVYFLVAIVCIAYKKRVAEFIYFQF